MNFQHNFENDLQKKKYFYLRNSKSVQTDFKSDSLDHHHLDTENLRKKTTNSNNMLH